MLNDFFKGEKEMRKLKIVIFAAVFGAILFGTALSAGAEKMA